MQLLIWQRYCIWSSRIVLPNGIYCTEKFDMSSRVSVECHGEIDPIPAPSLWSSSHGSRGHD